MLSELDIYTVERCLSLAQMEMPVKPFKHLQYNMSVWDVKATLHGKANFGLLLAFLCLFVKQPGVYSSDK